MDVTRCYFDKLDGTQKATLMLMCFAHPLCAFAFNFSPELWFALYPQGLISLTREKFSLLLVFDSLFVISQVFSFLNILAILNQKFRFYGGSIFDIDVDAEDVVEKIVHVFNVTLLALAIHVLAYLAMTGMIFLNHLIACLFFIWVNIFLIPRRRLRHMVEFFKRHS